MPYFQIWYDSTRERKETWLSDYAISANNFDLALETFLFRSFLVLEVLCFYLFLRFHLDVSQKINTERANIYIRINWFMIPTSEKRSRQMSSLEMKGCTTNAQQTLVCRCCLDIEDVFFKKYLSKLLYFKRYSSLEHHIYDFWKSFSKSQR